MNHFMLPSPQRLQTWGQFRDGLKKLDESTQLQDVVKFWSQCPFAKWTLEPEDTKTWPSIWEMLNDGDYCRNAIAIGMEATLRLGGWAPERLKLVMVKNHSDGDEFFTVIIDDTHVLNYSYGELVTVDDIATGIDTRYAYKWVGRAYKRVA